MECRRAWRQNVAGGPDGGSLGFRLSRDTKSAGQKVHPGAWSAGKAMGHHTETIVIDQLDRPAEGINRNEGATESCV